MIYSLEDPKVFLGYCVLHSMTTRALFHGTHVRRLFELADEPMPDYILARPGQPFEFVAMHYDHVLPLAKKALKRLQLGEAT